MRDNPNEAILRDRARRPTRIRLRHQPRFGPNVMDLGSVKERDEHVHIEERGQRNSSSRSRSINSDVTTTPRAGNGLNPRNSSSGFESGAPFDTANPFLASSDKTCPALLRSCLLSAFAAMSTF